MTVTVSARQERAYAATGRVGRHLTKAHELQLQIQKLEAELSRHREFLLQHMAQQQLDRIELGSFKATRKVRHNWQYSAYMEAFQLRVRQLQKQEQQQGVAVDNPTVYVSLSTAA